MVKKAVYLEFRVFAWQVKGWYNIFMKQEYSRGFTLVEMLIVITIIGILSGIGLVHYQNVRAAARDARRKSDLAYIRLALALYEEDNGSYPIPVAGTTPGDGPDKSTDASDGTIFSKNNNPLYPSYLSTFFIDPANDEKNYYQYDTNQNNEHKDYVLCIHKESATSEDNSWIAFFSMGGAENLQSCPNLPGS